MIIDDKITKLRKQLHREDATTVVENFCFENNILVEKRSIYHFTLKRAGFVRVDIWPTSSKVKAFTKKPVIRVVDLYKWLRFFYKNAVVK